MCLPFTQNLVTSHVFEMETFVVSETLFCLQCWPVDKVQEPSNCKCNIYDCLSPVGFRSVFACWGVGHTVLVFLKCSSMEMEEEHWQKWMFCEQAIMLQHWRWSRVVKERSVVMFVCMPTGMSPVWYNSQWEPELQAVLPQAVRSQDLPVLRW